MIEPVGGEADAAGDRRVERVPDQIVQLDVSRAGRVSPGGGISTVLARAEHDRAEHAADRLGEARRRCIASPGSDRDSRNPRPARGAARRRRGDGSRRRRAMPEIGDEHEDQQAVVGAAAFGDRHDREPVRRRSAPACARRRALCTTGASASMNEAGQDAGDQAERREDEHRGEREAVGLLRAARRPACAAGRGRSRRTP